VPRVGEVEIEHRGFELGVPQGALHQAGGHAGCGQGDVPIFGALAAVDLDWQALPVNSGDLEEESCMEPEASTKDGGAVDWVMQGGSGREEPPDFLHTEDGGEMVGGWHTQERQRGPVALEDVLREKADAARAETQGRGGEAVDVFPEQARALQLLFGDAVGGCVLDLRQQTDFPDRGGLRPFACATALESRKHVLT
jgi:hypothetical protein